jgi:hypothetical protein
MTKHIFDEYYKEFPEVLARMMWHQAKQGRPMTFSTDLDSREFNKGFSWQKTPEGISFWSHVMRGYYIASERADVHESFPHYRPGSIVSIYYNGKPKNYRFIAWDLPGHAIIVMTEVAYALLNSREPSFTNKEEIRRIPLETLIW